MKEQVINPSLSTFVHHPCMLGLQRRQHVQVVTDDGTRQYEKQLSCKVFVLSYKKDREGAGLLEAHSILDVRW